MDWKKIVAPLSSLLGTGMVAQGAFGMTAAHYTGAGLSSGYGIAQAGFGLLGAALLGLREWKFNPTASAAAEAPFAALTIKVGDKEVKFNFSGEDAHPRLPEAMADIVNTVLTSPATEGSNVVQPAPVPVPRGYPRR